MVITKNKFDNLQEISEKDTLNVKYKNFVITQIAAAAAAAECMPTKSKAKSEVPWVSLVDLEK